MIITSNMQPVASIFFMRNRDDLAQYWVTAKKGKRIPAFLGEFKNGSFLGVEGILLDYDLQSDGQNYEWSFYTTNKDAIAAKRLENPGQEIMRVRIMGFLLNSELQAYGEWNDFCLKIIFSNDKTRYRYKGYESAGWEGLEIQFFERPLKK